eukprot:m.136081 g.136081  ORF g.136081 m.136081 type:complete len:546 (+) comp16021_c0_seq2:83-1720(+)
MSFLKRHDKPSDALQAAARMHGLTLYYCKYYGKEDVPSNKGNSVVDYALHQILVTKVASKKQGWRPPRVEFSVGVSGVKVTDRSNGTVFLDLPLQNISYCQDDRKGNNIFAFIAREKATSPQCCYAFKSYNQAQEIMNALGVAFSEAAAQKKAAGGRGQGRGSRGRSQGSARGRGRGRGASQRGRGRGSPQRPSQQRGAPVDVEREMMDLEKAFESDFKFAVKRAAVTDKVKATTSEDVFGQNTSQPSNTSTGFGASFDDAFDATSQSPIPAPMPTSQTKAQGSRSSNPYARQRGAPPPAQLSASSQIQVPAEALKLRQKAKPVRDDDDDDFAALASARLNSPSPAPVSSTVVEPEPEVVPTPDTFEAAAEEEDTEDESELIEQLEADMASDEFVCRPVSLRSQASKPALNGDGSDEDAIEEHVEEHVEDVVEETTAVVDDAPENDMALVKLCQHIWTLATPDDDGCLDGGQMRPLMMMSGLPMDVLGEVWALVDDEQNGKINYRQLGFLLGLISQAQNKQELDITTIGPTTPAPELDGLKPMDD